MKVIQSISLICFLLFIVAGIVLIFVGSMSNNQIVNSTAQEPSQEFSGALNPMDWTNPINPYSPIYSPISPFKPNRIALDNMNR